MINTKEGRADGRRE